jgi:hypothetical protein
VRPSFRFGGDGLVVALMCIDPAPRKRGSLLFAVLILLGPTFADIVRRQDTRRPRRSLTPRIVFLDGECLPNLVADADEPGVTRVLVTFGDLFVQASRHRVTQHSTPPVASAHQIAVAGNRCQQQMSVHRLLPFLDRGGHRSSSQCSNQFGRANVRSCFGAVIVPAGGAPVCGVWCSRFIAR